MRQKQFACENDNYNINEYVQIINEDPFYLTQAKLLELTYDHTIWGWGWGQTHNKKHIVIEA